MPLHQKTPTRPSLRIVCAEDSVDVCRAMKSALEAYGHQVDYALDGAHALACIQTSLAPIDLLIADHAMPGMSGCELVMQARTGGYKGRIIIYCTPLRHEDGVIYRTLGVTEFLRKPARVDELLKAVAGHEAH